MRKPRTVVAVSGGFDPLHVGHLRLFEEAKKLGTHLVVILNNDHWLCKKKGFVFMPEHEREMIIRALKMVDDVVITDHAPDDSDPSVCRTLSQLKPHIFANAGDRKEPGDIPETLVCKEHGIGMHFFSFDDLHYKNGAKKHSSSTLVKQAADFFRISVRKHKQEKR